MEFKDYYKKLKADEKRGLANACSASTGYLRLIAYGHRQASADLAIEIERESGGKVRCETLRPDVDWSYIRGTKKTSKEVAA